MIKMVIKLQKTIERNAIIELTAGAAAEILRKRIEVLFSIFVFFKYNCITQFS